MSPLRRPATIADAPAIAAVHRAAFPTDAEARLVAALVADGDALVSLVADADGAIAGHVLFSRMQAVADRATLPAAALAPVAVMPERQEQGIGSGLIQAGLAALATGGVEIVFVLGDPRYYRRFGFDAAVASPFASPYAGSHLMAQWLGKARSVAVGRADYAPAFARMGVDA